MNLNNEIQFPVVCQICASQNLLEVEAFGTLKRISSDCHLHVEGGRLFVCSHCSGVQKIADTKWLREIEEIYLVYNAYYQSGGDEQIVFDSVTGRPRRRSEVILDRLLAGKHLPEKGRALDVGCANGAMLKAMSSKLPGWSLCGHDLNDSAHSRLAEIIGFEKLYTGSLDKIGSAFDLFTLIHSLEHFPCPLEYLQQLHGIIGKGQLFIEVCNIDENPFDILVADHLLHFSPDSLQHLLNRAGFSTETIDSNWIPKEISLLARMTTEESFVPEATLKPGLKVFKRISSYVNWLQNIIETLETTDFQERTFGIFGSSIAATWLARQLGDRVAFFVDEDKSRVGKKHLNKPIIPPNEIPAAAVVYLALAPKIAAIIAARFASLPCIWLSPPPLQTE